MPTITVDVSGDGGLGRLIAGLSDMAGAYEAGREPLIFARDLVFSREGPGWEPLSERRVAERGGEAHPILEFTGSYRESFEALADAGGLELASGDHRAGLLNFGGMSQDGGGVPARPVELDAESEETVTRAIVDHALGRA